MATTVGQHSVAAFTSPVNGTTPIDANTVRGNDNTVRVAYVDHDADPGIHVQSSTLASRPAAGTAGRKWITNDNDVYTLWFDDGSNWHPVSSENVALTVLATTALTKGDVVKVTGWNNGQDLPEVAKVASASDVAFAVISADVSINTMGYATNTGLLLDFNTNGFNVGDILYPNTSGGFTATKPTSGNYQPCAYVLRKNANNGVLYVEFSAPRIVESSSNTASTVVLRDASGNFSAGTITAGAVTSTGLVTFASLKGTGSTTVTNILNDDTMATASATTLATSASIKTYVDNKAAAQDTLAEVLANGNTTGANNIIVSAGQRIQTPAITAGDGTASATIANSTGVMTIASSVLTTTDINGGTIDGTIIGGASAAAGTFTTVAATTGNITTVNATTVDTTNIEVTNVKAKDGTASIAIADSTGVATISAAPVLSALTASQAVFTDASKGLVSNAITGTGNVVMSASPTLTGTITAANVSMSGTLTLGSDVALSRGAADRLDLATGDSLNVVSGTYKIAGTDVLSSNTLGSGVTASSLTSVGTLSSLTISGDLTVDTSTLKVDSTNDTVGIGKAPGTVSKLNVARAGTTSGPVIAVGNVGTGEFGGLAVSDGGTYPMELWASALSFRTGNSTYASSTEKMVLTSGGNLAVDTNTLYVDATNNRVGIGTATPSTPLHVVGIARTGGVQVNTSALVGGMFSAADWLGSGSSLDLAISAYSGGGNITFYTNGGSTERMRLDASGNLGLGVTPSAWATIRGIEIAGLGNAVSGYPADAGVYLTSNAYYGSGGWKYGYSSKSSTLYSGEGGVHAWKVAGTGTAGNAITFTQAMTLDASGNLGVNTTNGAGKLSVRGPGTTTGYSFEAANSAGTSRFAVRDDGLIQFFSVTAGTESARITSGGYFKASNDATYVNSTGSYHEIRSSTNAAGIVITNTSATYTDDLVYGSVAVAAGTGFKLMRLDANSVEQFRVRGDGTIFAQNTTVQSLSDARLKENIVDATEGLAVISALRPVRYDWKKGYGNDRVNQLGFIAQEMEAVFPEAVSVWEMDEPTGEVDEDGKPITEKVDYKTVGPGALIPVLVKAIQELEARIAALEA